MFLTVQQRHVTFCRGQSDIFMAMYIAATIFGTAMVLVGTAVVAAAMVTAFARLALVVMVLIITSANVGGVVVGWKQRLIMPRWYLARELGAFMSASKGTVVIQAG